MKTILFLALSLLACSCENLPGSHKTKPVIAEADTVRTTMPNTFRLGRITCFDDYDAGLAYAKKINKPILLNFTGYASITSRKMEDYIWVNPVVYKSLNEEYVVISLFIDDKKALPEEEHYKSSFGKNITRMGQKWMDLEMTRFNKNTTPLYVILDGSGEKILGPAGYTSDVDLYSDFLKQGLSRFRK